MVLIKGMSMYCIRRNPLLMNLVFFNFQGHYVNRQITDFGCHCHGPIQQNRTFLSFTKQSRTRKYRGRQLVGHTMEQMFDVVSDVDSYSSFLPWCKKSIVSKRSMSKLEAELVIGFPPINESYTSIVTLIRPNLVKAECLDGKVFHHMLTVWRFSPGLKKNMFSCVVDFQIDFEFRTAFHSHLSNIFLDQVGKQMESAFIKEVARRYGPASMQPINLLISNEKS